MLFIHERKAIMRYTQKKNNSAPFLGLMASEGGQREEALVEHGCNYFGKSVIRSAPFAPFLRQDLLQLALDLNVPVPEIYGEIAKESRWNAVYDKAQRTGCSMWDSGVHLEENTHRFDMLRERNEKEWEFWMYRCCRSRNRRKIWMGTCLRLHRRMGR